MPVARKRDPTLDALRLADLSRPGDKLALVRRQERLKIFIGAAPRWRNITPVAATVCKLSLGDDLALVAEAEMELIKVLAAALPPVREVVLFDVKG